MYFFLLLSFWFSKCGRYYPLLKLPISSYTSYFSSWVNNLSFCVLLLSCSSWIHSTFYQSFLLLPSPHCSDISHPPLASYHLVSHPLFLLFQPFSGIQSPASLISRLSSSSFHLFLYFSVISTLRASKSIPPWSHSLSLPTSFSTSSVNPRPRMMWGYKSNIKEGEFLAINQETVPNTMKIQAKKKKGTLSKLQEDLGEFHAYSKVRK